MVCMPLINHMKVMPRIIAFAYEYLYRVPQAGCYLHKLGSRCAQSCGVYCKTVISPILSKNLPIQFSSESRRKKTSVRFQLYFELRKINKNDSNSSKKEKVTVGG